MPRPTRLLEGRVLLPILVGSLLLASLWALVTLNVSEAAAGPDRALLRRAALTGPSLFGSPRPGRAAFTAARDTDTLALPPFTLDSLDAETDTPAAQPDSTEAALADTSAALPTDTTGLALADTTEALPDTGRVGRLLPSVRRDFLGAALNPRRRSPLSPPLGNYWERRVVLDSTEAAYTITERVGESDVRVPVRLGLDAYRDLRLRYDLQQTFRAEADARSRRQQRRGDLSLLNIEVPGGRNSAFAGIFGSNEVDLRVNGQANVDVGFAYRKNEQQEAATGQGGRVDPDFGQELGLGITGTIGDKLQINVNYDTQNDFDFQNQVKLTYTGYEDEILQRVEAGNVFLQTPSELIRGGQRLFGIRSDLQIGGLGVTVVASQQDAESDELSIEGGSQTTTFSKRPTEYENNTNFYLGYYFHNRWDAAHAAPPNIVLGSGFSEILEGNLEVYLYEQSNVNNTGSDDALVAGLALADLGEPPSVLTPAVDDPDSDVLITSGQLYLAEVGEGVPGENLPGPPLPDPAVDRYSEEALDFLRDGDNRNTDVAELFPGDANTPGVRNADYFETNWRKLREGQDYTWDRRLGALSLKRSLNNNEAIAVAYRYQRADGTTVEIGDYGQGSGSSGNSDNVILKLLRGPNPLPSNATWDLTMRNIYRVGGSAFNATDFMLQVLYAAPGQTAQRTLPGVDVGQQQTLLQTLGLDRVNQDGAPGPDDLFDFLQNYTVDPGNGRIIFPYRRPFGEHLQSVLLEDFEERNQTPDVSFQGLTQEAALGTYVFGELYDRKPEQAARETSKNVYDIGGEFRGSVQEIYDLGFAVVENSVRVRSGNIDLTEGADYTVDYATGTVTITNPAFLVAGRDVNISFERNQFVAIQKKTLLGIRADYAFSDRFGVGATWMQLSEKPLIDKYRLGEEPIANSIWGVDFRYAAEPRWMTRLVDALPLVQTRAPSAFEFKGEFAQLNPGHPDSFAFEQSQDDLQDLGRDFKDDELDGISYIDDFEGTENTFSLLQPGSWLLASAPSGTLESPGAGPDGAQTYLSDLPGEESVTSPLLRTNWRGRFGWYSVLTATYESDAIRPLATNPATSRVLIEEVFPEREPESGAPPTLTTFDLYFDPTRRGPYNYNSQLGTAFTERTEDVWGGMTQRLPEGYTDFDARNNIEFVEFIFAPYGGRNADQPIDPNARLYIELGQTSEDIIPNRSFNKEDGLLGGGTTDLWGQIPNGQTNGIVNVNEETQRTEDLGLDGLPSEVAASAARAAGAPYSEQSIPTETEQFAPFLDSLRAGLAAGSPVLALAELDPSGDDFHSFQDDAFFNNGTLWPGGATLQERFSQFFPGLELNSLEAQRQIAESGVPGNSRFPDSEDLNLNLSLDQAESFFRYEIPLDTTLLTRRCADGQTQNCNPFYVTTIQNDEIQGARKWYLIRIPVRSDQKETVGGIEDFSLIETIRVWTDGHSTPTTLRFATLDLVGSQWLKSERVGIDETEGPVVGLPESPAVPQSFVATINNEENPDQYEIPNGTVRSFTRDPTSSQPLQAREQALIFRVNNLGDGQQRAIFKPYTRQLDLTKYSNLRMFVHGEGFEREDSVRVFVRLGSNETDDYYELEQPVYPFEVPEGTSVNAIPSAADSLWQTNVPVETPEGTRFIDLNSINIEFDALNKLKLERDLATAGNNTNTPIPLDSVYTARSIPLDFAPPGATLKIRGNPSIQNVSNIVLGVRNASDDLGRPLNVEVWYNELRVSGFDEQPGWSGYARTTVRLADFLDINARYDQQTDGFGELASGLGNRTFEDRWGYSVTTNLNAHKFLPERFGWRIPINFAVQQDVSTPRFSPSRGDITVAQEIAQIQESDRLSPEEKEAEIAEVRAAAETAGFSRVIRVPISKSGSRSPWLRYTLDGLALTYTNTLRQQRSPSRLFNDTKQWNSALTYRLNVPRPKTIRPFWLLDDLPLVGLLGGLQLNVLPQSVRLTADASRSVNENQDRPRRGVRVDSTRAALEAARPDFVYPIRQQHTFSHRRGVEVQYDPFQFLALGYRSDVRQSLNSAGADEFVSTLVQSRTDVDRFEEYPGLSFDEVFAFEITDVDTLLLGPGFDAFEIDDIDEIGAFVNDYQTSQLDVIPAHEVVGDLLSGERSVLTDDYNQNTTATIQSPFDRVQALDWFRLQPVTYSSNFTWRFTPIPGQDLRDRADSDTTVAAVANQASVRGGLSLRLGDLFGKIGPYRRLRESQDEAQQGRQQRRQEFEQELQRYRAVQDRLAEAEAALAEAEAEAEAADSLAAATLENRLGRLRTELESAQAADTLARPNPPLPIPNPLGLLRRGFLALTGPRDIAFTYNGSFSGSSTGALNPGYSLLDGLTGDGPGLGYRLGFDRRLSADTTSRFFGNSEFGTLEVQDILRDNHQVGARTSLEFSQALRVDLTWDLGLQSQQTYSFTRNNADEPTLLENGNGSATVLALGGSYDKFFDLHRDRYDRSVANDTISAENVFSGGFLSNNAVVEDFRNAFLTDLGSIGSGGFAALPLPNWTVTYTGASSWPLLRALTQSVTLRHGYSATYDVGYRSNPLVGSLNEESLSLIAADGSPIGTTFRFVSDTPALEASTVRVSERFQPLLGVNLGFKGGIQADINWISSESYALTPAQGSVNELQTDEVSIRLSFNKTGFRIPLPFLNRRRLNNNLRFSLIVSRAENTARRFELRNDLQQSISEAINPITFKDPQGELTTRLSVEPQLSYTLSNQVTATAFVRYQKFDSEGSINPSTTTLNGGFTFRVSFSN